MSKFDEYFCEVQTFSNGTRVLSGSFSISEAAKMFSEYFGEETSEEAIEADSVRFGFAPENVEDTAGESCWHTGGSNSKGAKKVWVIN